MYTAACVCVCGQAHGEYSLYRSGGFVGQCVSTTESSSSSRPLRSAASAERFQHETAVSVCGRRTQRDCSAQRPAMLQCQTPSQLRDRDHLKVWRGRRVMGKSSFPPFKYLLCVLFFTSKHAVGWWFSSVSILILWQCRADGSVRLCQQKLCWKSSWGVSEEKMTQRRHTYKC